ncbi:MAG TPA: leucyl/phenylalanyl-tRNA--protein transferase [Chthoniobacterales bacterium]|nr:leucyl/phenylalanyl-tRNA--protein transferase [Chthoniobacterales bacterium]
MREKRRTKIISPSLLLEAYCRGVFPMAMENGEIGWFSPDPRGIIPLDAFHVPHGLKRVLKKGIFQIKLDTSFEAVVRACADRPETWISDRIIESYANLHRLGFAHSVEAWLEDKLAGGLYGVSVQGAFFGESMFHRVPDASKVALVELVNRLNNRAFRLLDTQFVNIHLKQFGAIEIPRQKYMHLLKQALAVDTKFL